MDVLNHIIAIVPSYNPDEKLAEVIEGLEQEGFREILVVNDGSTPEAASFFPAPREGLTLLTHDVNRGKGAAMKTAFRYVLEHRPDCTGVVTVDGDNQHRPKDVVKCVSRLAEGPAMILGVRDFSLPHVPRRSRIGNRITSAVFHLGCGIKISDTQTGLRVFPRAYLPALLQIDGDRYEFETNMLLSLKEYGMTVREETIETVYIEENQTSHFHPVRDSLRIYSLILKFVASSLICTAVDQLAFYLLMKCIGGRIAADILVCTFCARVVSSTLNFEINRKKVFKSSEGLGLAFLRFAILAVSLVLLSSATVTVITHLAHIEAPSLTTLIKILVDMILFFCSFRLQRNWVFASHHSAKGVSYESESTH